MTRRRFSLSRLLGLGHDEPPAHADEPVEDFLDPYRAAGVDRAYLAGRAYRRRYLEHTTDEAAVAREAERRAVAGEVGDPYGKPVSPRPVDASTRPLVIGERPPKAHYGPTHWPRTAWPTWRVEGGDSR